jgi:transcriptional regulator with XRE-family HTH domain
MAVTKALNSKQSRTLFSGRLKAAREAKGYTKDKLGKLVGIHHSQIGRSERGDASPSAEVLK